MSSNIRASRLIFSDQRLNEAGSPAGVLKSMWVSTAIALILTLPPLGIFLGLLHLTNNMILGSMIGFATHFSLLAFSPRTSEALLSLFD
jgi:hypothetical protein